MSTARAQKALRVLEPVNAAVETVGTVGLGVSALVRAEGSWWDLLTHAATTHVPVGSAGAANPWMTGVIGYALAQGFSQIAQGVALICAEENENKHTGVKYKTKTQKNLLGTMQMVGGLLATGGAAYNTYSLVKGHDISSLLSGSTALASGLAVSAFAKLVSAIYDYSKISKIKPASEEKDSQEYAAWLKQQHDAKAQIVATLLETIGWSFLATAGMTNPIGWLFLATAAGVSYGYKNLPRTFPFFKSVGKGAAACADSVAHSLGTATGRSPRPSHSANVDVA